MNKYQQVQNLIGSTPIVYLEKFSKKYNSEIFLKLESKNAGGSVKDRVAKYMIENALKEGKIQENGTLVEPTSGNTGIGLALLASFYNLKLILVMPESMSIERRKLFKAYGAELVLTKASDGMAGACKKAEEIVTSLENAFMPDQFSNSSCIQAHYENTAVEIENFMQENSIEFDAFFAGVGTGATISGVGKYFKEKHIKTRMIAIEPSTSAVLSGQEKGVHGIQGIGAGFIPMNFHKEYIDEISLVSTDEAIEKAREIMLLDGISCGISTGANMHALVEFAKKNNSSKLLTIAPDSIDKYLSTALFVE